VKNQYDAIIELDLPSETIANIVYRALKPESDIKAQIMVADNVLTLHLTAGTIAVMRALTNSYLRWIGSILQLFSIEFPIREN